MYKTGVINDPLSQPTVPAGSLDLFCFGRFWKVGTNVRTYRQTDVRTTCVNIVITSGRDCGRLSGSIACSGLWHKNETNIEWWCRVGKNYIPNFWISPKKANFRSDHFSFDHLLTFRILRFPSSSYKMNLFIIFRLRH